MKDDPVPDNGHITRYCGGGSLLDGQPTGTSFLLKGHEYLSVNWLEHLNLNDRGAEIQEIRRVLDTKLTVGSTAQIAVLNVGQVKSRVTSGSSDRQVIEVRHRPDEPPGVPDPSHSGIFDTALDEPLVVELIAQVVQETYSAS